MLSYASEIIAQAENEAATHGLRGALVALRRLPLDDFGELMISLPHVGFPRLSALLPRMASEQTQVTWTGSSGMSLLGQTNAFARLLAFNYERISGNSISNAMILDFGCGYGRIIRSLYYFADPWQIYGCDPWDVSIDLCEENGLLGHIALSEYLPRSLPFRMKFHLIYSFSVFTHLSERAANRCLSTLAEALPANGLLALTIRPVEYWLHDARFTIEEREQLMELHRARGFAFSPHNRPPVDGDITYGDTSMSLAHLNGIEPRLRICGIDRAQIDPLQVVVFMRRR